MTSWNPVRVAGPRWAFRAVVVLVAALSPAAAGPTSLSEARTVPATSVSGPVVPAGPHTGDRYLYSQTADESYKRLTRVLAVPADGGSLTFWASVDTETDWDYLFVEARSPGGDDWTTLPDSNGHTTTSTGSSCAEGWSQDLHPQLAHYQTWDGEAACVPTGTTGAWNAASGTSGGWWQWRIDLGAYAGRRIEVSIAYASDWESQGTGVSIDDVVLPDGTSTSFEGGLEGWLVADPPKGTAHNDNTFVVIGASRCLPQAYTVSGLTTGEGWIGALSDSGLAVGSSEDHAVVWRDPTHPLDTGIGGVILADHAHTVGAAIDVNESGVVAINETTYTRRGNILGQKALLWTETAGATRLPATRARPDASLSAVNDHGVAVGFLQANGRQRVPVAWIDGRLRRLPLPPRLHGVAVDINNQGLVVGFVEHQYRSLPWAWRVNGAGRALALRSPSASVSVVDDQGRIIGSVAGEYSSRSVLWRDRWAKPRPLSRLLVTDVHDGGFLAAHTEGFRGYGARAYVGRLGDRGRAALASPYSSSVWDNTIALGVARGVSGFAPQGGLTVVGFANGETGWRGVIWTCAQTLL